MATVRLMEQPGVTLDQRLGPYAGRIDEALVARYAAATNDPNERVRAGLAVPPAAIVTQIWEAQEATRAQLVSPHVSAGAVGGVHGEHDIVLHRPIRIGETLHTWVDGYGARPAGRHSVIVLRYTTLDDAGALVAEQLWSTVYFGVTCAATGATVPDHGFADEVRERPLGTYQMHLDDGMARRYAEASGDWSAHHFDVAAAEVGGFDRIFLHGLCTLGIAAQAVVTTVAEGDPDRIRRLAVRFASPAFIGDDLEVRLFDAGPSVVAFEATSNGVVVLSQGRVELR
jgi:acyl dehydratase